jgi:RNA polymerase sigma-70 factor (ECF subfamily)
MPPDTRELSLESFRSYLLVLARARMDPRLRRHLDDMDIVQQTLLEAFRDRHSFRGKTEAELATWLRRILVNNLAGAVRDLTRACRNVDRETSFDDALHISNNRLEDWLADEDGKRPDILAEQREEADRLAQAIAALPEEQRDVIVMRHFHGWPVADIATFLSRSTPSVAGHLFRGMAELRRRLLPHATES